MAKLPTDTKEEFEQYQLPENTQNDTLPIVPSASGAVLSTGEFASPNFVSGVSGWKLDAQGNFEGVSGSFSGTVNVSSLNIPNATSANSFHIDSNGNSWWGANVATGYTGANAYILNTGAAVFKNVQIGGTTIQYVITNSGIFSYGDGSDGAATCDGSTSVAGMSLAGSTYTLTRDVYFTTLAVNNSVTVKAAGYRIFCSQSLTVGQGSSGVIHFNGNDGGTGSQGGDAVGTGLGGAGGGGGSIGTALSDGYLKGSLSPGASGSGGKGTGVSGTAATAGNNGSAGTTTANSLGSASVAGGTGGSSGGGAGGSSGSTASVTASNVKLIANWHLATLLDVGSTGTTIKFTSSASAPGSGGGAGGTRNGASESGGGGGGGGSGSASGVFAIYSKVITLNTGSIISGNGGAGGTGGRGGNAWDGGGGDAQGGGGGGGGAGGNGGIVILVYNMLTNNGSITATGGTKGTGGTFGTGVRGGSNGNAGADGNNGSAGAIYQFQLSL